jgi:hypothetical protein
MSRGFRLWYGPKLQSGQYAIFQLGAVTGLHTSYAWIGGRRWSSFVAAVEG